MSVTVHQLLQFLRERRIAPLVLRQISQWAPLTQERAHEALAGVYQDLCKRLAQRDAPVFQAEREVEEDDFLIKYAVRSGAICFLSIERIFVPGGGSGPAGRDGTSLGGGGPRTYFPSRRKGEGDSKSLATLLSSSIFSSVYADQINAGLSKKISTENLYYLFDLSETDLLLLSAHRTGISSILCFAMEDSLIKQIYAHRVLSLIRDAYCRGFEITAFPELGFIALGFGAVGDDGSDFSFVTLYGLGHAGSNHHGTAIGAFDETSYALGELIATGLLPYPLLGRLRIPPISKACVGNAGRRVASRPADEELATWDNDRPILPRGATSSTAFAARFLTSATSGSTGRREFPEGCRVVGRSSASEGPALPWQFRYDTLIGGGDNVSGDNVDLAACMSFARYCPAATGEPRLDGIGHDIVAGTDKVGSAGFYGSCGGSPGPATGLDVRFAGRGDPLNRVGFVGCKEKFRAAPSAWVTMGAGSPSGTTRD